MKCKHIVFFFILCLLGQPLIAQVKGIGELDKYQSGKVLKDRERWVEEFAEAFAKSYWEFIENI